MKTKAQKQADLKEAKDRVDESKTLLFTNFGQMSAEDLRKLRREMKAADAKFSVVKKRLLNVLFKEEGIDYDARSLEGQVGTIFATGAIDTVSGPLYRFLNSLGADQKSRQKSVQRILGGYDLVSKSAVEADTVVQIGTLPPREILLAQLFGMLSAPVRAFLYILDQKSKEGGSEAPAEAVVATDAPAESTDSKEPAATATEAETATEAPEKSEAESADKAPEAEPDKNENQADQAETVESK